MQIDALSTANCDIIYKDHGISGAKSSRPGLDELLENIQSGDTVVVFKLDRLGRSVLHLADLLVLFRNEGIHFCSLAEGINTTTPGGKLVYHLFSAFAEFQRDIIIENTREGMLAAKRRGSPIGRPRSLKTQTVVLAYDAIMQNGVSIKDAARSLGVSRMTLDRAIKRLHLDNAVHFND
jgi:DNA invertase Pin-like site-specific DNA recombinase